MLINEKSNQIQLHPIIKCFKYFFMWMFITEYLLKGNKSENEIVSC